MISASPPETPAASRALTSETPAPRSTNARFVSIRGYSRSPANPITAQAPNRATVPITSVSASVRRRRVTSSHTSSVQGTSFASTTDAMAIAGGHGLARKRQATPAPSTSTGPRAPTSSPNTNGQDTSASAMHRQSRTPSNRSPPTKAATIKTRNSRPAVKYGSNANGTATSNDGAG